MHSTWWRSYALPGVTRGTHYSFSHTQTHSARIKLQVQVQRGPSGRSHTHSPFRHTSHSCPIHSLTHTSTHPHSTHNHNHSHTTLRECTSSLSHATVCCEDCSQHHTHTQQGLNMPNVQHIVEECSPLPYIVDIIEVCQHFQPNIPHYWHLPPRGAPSIAPHLTPPLLHTAEN